jgi:polysaccharide export outer membrane protein
MGASLIRSFLCLCIIVLAAAPVAAQRPPLESTTVQGDSTAMDWSQVSEYRIVPGDVLRLDVGQLDPEMVKDFRVRPDGRISVFPVGDVVAAGRTARELEAVLIDMLSAEYKNPRLTVILTEIAGNQVHVIGRVKAPGSYPAEPFVTVLQAITRAGGFEDDAARNSLVVFHREGARTATVTRIRLDEAVKSGRLDADFPLSRFDIVYVPRSTIGNINVFAKQFFGEQVQVLHFMLLGWELFHLDRTTVVTSR